MNNEDFMVMTRNQEIPLVDIHLDEATQINKGWFLTIYNQDVNEEVIYLAQIVSESNDFQITWINSSNQGYNFSYTYRPGNLKNC